MRSSSASPTLWLTYLAIILTIALLLWLPFEDNSEVTVLVFAAAVSSLLATRSLLRFHPDTIKDIFRYLGVGSLAGFAVTPIALLLMVFKTGIHRHGISDYSQEQIISVLLTTPVWFTVGFVSGMGGGILRYKLGMENGTFK